MSLNFADIANKKFADVEKPKLPPMGTYRWQITKAPGIESSKDGKWDFVSFPCTAVEMVDGDFASLSAFGELKNVRQSLRFLFDKNDPTAFANTEYRLRRFLVDHVKCASETDSISEGLARSVNGQFLADLTHTQDTRDPENFFANIGKTAPIV